MSVGRPSTQLRDQPDPTIRPGDASGKGERRAQATRAGPCGRAGHVRRGFHIFAGSQALVTQLIEGAKADVFASASAAQMKAAQDAGVIEGPSTVFTQNRLAIVVPKDNPAGIQNPADLAKPGLKLVLAQAEVPVGQYARQGICTAGQDTATYGEGFVDKVAANVVSEEDNVKAVLAKVQLGEADAGIVYTTDVTTDVAADVTLIELPPAINVVATYPIAVVKGGNTELADAFIAFVLGEEGQAILAKYGFEPRP
jgi:molybdate transport system substrate-binding protein